MGIHTISATYDTLLAASFFCVSRAGCQTKKARRSHAVELCPANGKLLYSALIVFAIILSMTQEKDPAIVGKSTKSLFLAEDLSTRHEYIYAPPWYLDHNANEHPSNGRRFRAAGDIETFLPDSPGRSAKTQLHTSPTDAHYSHGQQHSSQLEQPKWLRS